MKQFIQNIAFVVLVTGLSVSGTALKAQDVEGSMVYTLDLIANPAFTGATGSDRLGAAYRDFYPGRGLGINSFYLGYDSFFETLHGGAGGYIYENRLGSILNELNFGTNYSYHLRASRDLYINAGFNINLMYRSVNRGNIVLPDQIDPFLGPVLPTSEVLDIPNRFLFDAAVGFLLSYKDYNAGLSFSHIARPDLTGQSRGDGRLKRRLMFHADARFGISENTLVITPLTFNNLQGNYFFGATGVRLTYNVVTMNMLVHYSNGSGIYSLQPGISIETGRVVFAYNFLFSPDLQTGGLPAAQSNMISVNIRFQNVNKSGVIKAIKYPKL